MVELHVFAIKLYKIIFCQKYSALQNFIFQIGYIIFDFHWPKGFHTQIGEWTSAYVKLCMNALSQEINIVSQLRVFTLMQSKIIIKTIKKIKNPESER